MGLREVLAELDVKVRGGEKLDQATREVDRFVRSAMGAQGPAQTYSRSIERMRATTQPATAATGGLASSLRSAGAALAVVGGFAAAVDGAVSAVSALVHEVVELGDALDIQSRRMGISSTELQRWRFVADQVGTEAEDVDGAFTGLSRSLVQAANGQGAAARAFRELNVPLRDGNGELRDRGAIMRDTITALGQVDNRTRQAALAQQVFRRSGEGLLPLINASSEEIARLSSRFSELGGGIDEATVASSAEANDAIAEFQLALLGLKGVLVASILPAITSGIRAFAGFIGELIEIARTSSAVQVALGVIAAAAAILAVPVLAAGAAFILLLVPLAALVLVVEDLVTAFRGGESTIGSFVEEMLSAMGVTLRFTEVVDSFGLAWTMAVADAREALAGLLESAVIASRALGLDVPQGLRDAAVSARMAAAASRLEATQGQATFVRRAQEGRAEEARLDAIRNAPPPVVQRRGASPAGTVGSGSASGVGGPATIVVQGAQDPDVTARAVRRELARQFASAARASLPQAAPEGA